MKAVLEQIEFTYWQFHLKILDQSLWVRRLLPRFRGVWQVRREIGISLFWALLGFPLGLLIGFLQALSH